VVCACRGLGQASPYLRSFAQGKAAAHKIFALIRRVPPIDSSDTAGLQLESIRGDIALSDIDFTYPVSHRRPVPQRLPSLAHLEASLAWHRLPGPFPHERPVLLAALVCVSGLLVWSWGPLVVGAAGAAGRAYLSGLQHQHPSGGHRGPGGQ
jgi:hypothetical protein